MNRNHFFIAIAFVGVFVSYLFFSVNKNIQIYNNWVQMQDVNFVSLYFQQLDFFLGLSYALAVAFTVYAFFQFMILNKNCVGGVIGGITLTGLLYFLGCFLIGCCGSPMLVVYLGVFGSSVLGFTKPLVFIITLISVGIGYFWIKKKAKSPTKCSLKKSC